MKDVEVFILKMSPMSNANAFHFHLWKILFTVNSAVLLLPWMFASGLCFKLTNRTNIKTFIVDGLRANQGEFPFHVALTIDESNYLKYRCGGTIIGLIHVLTAAHCVVDPTFTINPTNLKILGRTITLNEYDANDVFNVIDIVVHSGYVYNYILPPKNDIALLKVDRYFSHNPFLSYAMLPQRNPTVHDYCFAVGWGRTSSTRQEISPNLMKVRLPIVDTTTCSYIYWNPNDPFDTHSQICAGYATGRRGICSGDSGGPFVCQGTLIGVSSWGDMNCGNNGFPSVFINVFVYRSWILNNMR